VWGARIEWVRCETCDGCGVLGLYEGKWAIIPREHRLFVSEGTHFEAPLANTMKCPDCRLGGNWLPKEEKK
jgi:hypothetical protein